MRIIKILGVVFLLVVTSGCTCRTKKVSPDDVNIGAAEAGKELKDVNFGYDSYELDSLGKSILQANASWLKANPSRRVQVEGHCDERGTNEYNMILGANRARAAQDYLRSLGVESNRLSTVSYGEELALDPRHNEEAWTKNRRAHFAVQ